MGTPTLIISFILEYWSVLFIATICVIYYYCTSTFDHFKKQCIPYMTPSIFVGNWGERVTGTLSFFDFELKVYKHFKGQPFGGVFEGRKALLYIFDPELIKRITIKDYEHFLDRYTIGTNAPNYVKNLLIYLKGSKWKGVRSIISPSFSSARLKSMWPLFDQCSDGLVALLKQHDHGDIELKRMTGRFTLQTVGACVFGVNWNTIENDKFVEIAEQYEDMSFMKRMTLFFFVMVMPCMLKYLTITELNTDCTDELVRLLRASMAQRRKGPRINDFLQLLFDAADKEKEENSTKFLDEDTIIAQALVFLLAGYETSSALLSFAIHTLATKPHIQDKLRAHIEKVTLGQPISYEALSELSYLEGFLLETMRKYPSVVRYDRVCTKDYTLPGTSVRIHEGDVVCIPVAGVHMDPDIYENPEDFRPERYMQKDTSSVFLGFGGGPRSCIGSRFAMISAKLIMVKLMKNFKFTACSKTKDPIIFDKRSLLLKADTGIWVQVDSL